jgi:TrkA-N domain./Ion channel.
MQCKPRKRVLAILIVSDLLLSIIILLYVLTQIQVNIFLRDIWKVIVILSFINLILIRNLLDGIKLVWYAYILIYFLKILLAFTLLFQFPYTIIYLILEFILTYIIFINKQCFKNPSRLFAKPDFSVAIMVILMVFSYGFFGSLILGNQFIPKIRNPINAFYYTGEVITTLGFGDIAPSTYVAKIFTVTLAVLGLGSFFGAATIIIAPIVYTRGRKVVSFVDKIESQSLKDYVMIIGYSNFLETLVKKLVEKDELVIVIDKDESKRELIESMGAYFEGNININEIIRNFKLTRAKLIILGAQDDGNNLLNLNTIINLMGGEVKEKIIVLLNNSSNYNSFVNFAGKIIDISSLIYQDLSNYFGKD